MTNSPQQPDHSDPQTSPTKTCPSPDGGHCWHIHRGEAEAGRLVRYCCWCDTHSSTIINHGPFKERDYES